MIDIYKTNRERVGDGVKGQFSMDNFIPMTGEKYIFLERALVFEISKMA
jgi:hypothetical protein